MCHETIRLPNGQTITGRLVDHLGGGRVGIDWHGRRFEGVKVSSERRPHKR